MMLSVLGAVAAGKLFGMRAAAAGLLVAVPKGNMITVDGISTFAEYKLCMYMELRYLSLRLVQYLCLLVLNPRGCVSHADTNVFAH